MPHQIGASSEIRVVQLVRNIFRVLRRNDEVRIILVMHTRQHVVLESHVPLGMRRFRNACGNVKTMIEEELEALFGNDEPVGFDEDAGGPATEKVLASIQEHPLRPFDIDLQDVRCRKLLVLQN